MESRSDLAHSPQYRRLSIQGRCATGWTSATESSAALASERRAPAAQLIFAFAPGGSVLPCASLTTQPWMQGRRPMVLASLSSSAARQGAKFEKVMQGDSVAAAAPGLNERRAHSDDWYRDRCVFCAQCKGPVNSQAGKAGGRCVGCRRWHHAHCAAAAHADAPGQQGTANDFHSDECQPPFMALLAAAAAGSQVLPPPPQRGWRLPWQQPAPQADDPSRQYTWRLLDFSSVRQQYKQLKQVGVLSSFVQQHRHRRQAAAAQAVPPAGAGAAGQAAQAQAAPTTSSSEAELPAYIEEARRKAQAGGAAAARLRGVSQQPLESALDVADLLESDGPFAEPLKELLEDSFGLELRRGGLIVSAATFNLYGPDHARLQNLVTGEDWRRQGHATMLMGQLEQLLAQAGVGGCAVMLEPDLPAEDARAARQLFARKLRYLEAGPGWLLMQRRELPEYHKSLVGACTMLLKVLTG